jgi:hypothetical protein
LLKKSEIKRLNKAERVELFKTVRYSYIPHEDLIKLTKEKQFSDAKALILEGLSFKLNSWENAIREDLSINVEPRVTYDSTHLGPGFGEPQLAKIMGVQRQPDGTFDPNFLTTIKKMQEG